MTYAEHVRCSRCGKRVSGVDPEMGLIVRAWVECPECLEATSEKYSGSVRRLEALDECEALGRAGLTVSVCCGPSGTKPFAWSINVLTRRGEEFEEPFEAHDFPHAIEIAMLECTRRGWTE